MQFVSIEFFISFLLLVVLLWKCESENRRKNILLAFSYLFYAYWDVRFLVLLVLQTLIAYTSGVYMDSKNHNGRKKKATVGIISLLLILGFFKYFDFFIDTFCIAFRIEQTFALNILLPMGLSFYTFQSISYILDMYRGRGEGKYCLRDVALYIGFFPQLMSGPIVKAHDFLPQLKEEHKIGWSNVEVGAQIFLFGLTKKILIADRLCVYVDAIYAAPYAYGWLAILLAICSYSIQIYCDFSGYSDMAIGIGKMLGYDLGRNFNCPYLAKNPSDFWGRWHISLSSWFKEYLYFPLGGNRKGQFRTYFNLFVVMVVSGLWHGASLTFIAWGAIHGMASVFNKIFASICKQDIEQKAGSKCKKMGECVSCVVNFSFVTLAWVLFRAGNFRTAFAIYSRLFSLAEGLNYVYVYAVIFIVFFAIIHIYVALKYRGDARYIVLPLDKFGSWFIIWIVVLVMLVFSYSGETAFIYSQF